MQRGHTRCALYLVAAVSSSCAPALVGFGNKSDVWLYHMSSSLFVQQNNALANQSTVFVHGMNPAAIAAILYFASGVALQ
jgi:hypothetical protein